MKKKILIECICIALVVLFTYAAANKVVDYEKFRVQIGLSPLLTGFEGFIPWMVIGVEFIVAFLLLVPRFRMVALFAAFSLMTMFTAYIVAILEFSSFVPCSCGGVLEKLGWTEHLIFNSVFVLLALVGIILQINLIEFNRYGSERSFKKIFPTATGVSAMVVTTFSLSVGVVVGLWAWSEDIRERPGSFIREYPPHPVIEADIIELADAPYYFAGATRDRIYLANFTKPLEVLTVNADMSGSSTVSLDLGIDERLDYYRITVKVDSPYFYFMDGVIPYVYRGSIRDWRGEPFMKDNTYFIDALPISSNSLAICAISSKTSEKALGKIVVNRDVKLNHELLERQVDGVFDVDGRIAYGTEINRLVYLYHYRNEFIVMDTNLNLKYRGHTIDTFRTARVRIAEVRAEQAVRLAAPPVVTNKSHAVYKRWLFVHSLLPAKNEYMDRFSTASIVDVYDLNANTYEFSFHISDEGGEKMKEFMLVDDKLFALYKGSVRSYRLAEKYFDK